MPKDDDVTFVGDEESLGFATGKLGNLEGTVETAAKSIIDLVRFVAGVPDFRIEGTVLQIFKGAAVELIAATLGGDGDVSELSKFGIVVELRDLENIHGRGSVDGVLDLRGKSAADGDIAVRILLSAGNSGQHSQWTRGCAAVVHGEVGDLLEILGVTDGAVSVLITGPLSPLTSMVCGEVASLRATSTWNSQNPYETLRTS